MNTASNPKNDPDDLALAADLMRTCYELYRRSPTGLAPEIAHFTHREEGDAAWPKRHAQDAGGGDFTVKAQVGGVLVFLGLKGTLEHWRVERLTST